MIKNNLKNYKFYYECQNCFKPAFFLKTKPKRFDKTNSEYCIYSDGIKPKKYEKIVCPICKKAVLKKDLMIDFIKEFTNGNGQTA